MTNSSYIELAKKNIDSAKVISFDIFDTLLLRPYLSPKDLFLHIEREYSLNGFFVARIEAEKLARKTNKNREDINLEDIYKNIHKKFESAKKIELDWEYKVLTQNPEMKFIWDYAKQKNKKIIIVSDMYLPSLFLKRVLLKNGFKDFDYLYVSSDYAKTKKTGALFKYIISELNLVPNEIAHFGDNKKGDYEIPKKLGINSLLYTQVSQQFFNVDKRAFIFNKYSPKNLGNSILISLFAWYWQKSYLGLTSENYWENIGYFYAAPLAYGYSRWIEHTSNNLNIDHILFVARDGYLLQKVFQSFNQKIKNSYFYSPRFLNIICQLDYDDKNIDAILSFFSKKYPDIKEINNFKKIKTTEEKFDFINNHYQIFKRYADYEFDNYKKYVESLIGNNSNIAIIDTKTIAFTSQKILESSTSKKIMGLYWSTILTSKINNFNYMEYLPNNYPYYDSKIFSYNWKFIEVLLSSPEYPIKGVNELGNAIYDTNPSPDEINLRENFKQIEQGVDLFLADIKQLFGNTNIFIEGYSLIEWVNIFCKYPKNIDLESMSKLRQANDVSHKNYKPIFSTNVSFIDFLKRPNQSVNLTKKSLWKTLPQTILLNILRPFRIKRKSSKKIQVTILPYLSRQYFIFWLKLFMNIQLKITIGQSIDER